jgi:hypothetical protein
LIKELEQVSRRELGQPIRLEQREVERGVIAARGRYDFHPLTGEQRDQIHLGTDNAASYQGGGGGMNLSHYQILAPLGARPTRWLDSSARPRR